MSRLADEKNDVIAYFACDIATVATLLARLSERFNAR